MPAFASRRRRIASGAMPIPPPTRIAPAAPSETSRGRRERASERPRQLELVALLEGRQPRGARSHRLDQEVQPDAVASRLRCSHGEGPRKEGAPLLPAPALAQRQHVELAGSGLGTFAVDRAEDPVAAAGPVGHDGGGAPARRRQHALAHAASAERSATPCSSCSETRARRPRGAAAIARVAAEAPVSVVMHGMPRLVAAARISWPSARAPRPVGVLMTRSTVPSRM